MKKSFFYTVALLLAGTMMTACSGGDDVTSDVPPVPQPAAEAGDVVVLSGTLGSKGSVTRAIDAEGKGTWEKDDEFAIYYETSNGHASAVATVNNVNEDGSADFTATLSSPKTGDNVVKLVYPASAHDDEGGFNTDGLRFQLGTLDYINKHGLDIETAATTMNVEGTNAKLKNTVNMKPQVCLYTFNLKKDDNTDLSAIELDISDGTNSYTVIPTPDATNSFTVALLPASSANFTFEATTMEEGQDRGYKKQNVTLQTCTEENVGDVFDKDGKIYKVSYEEPDVLYGASFSNITLASGMFYSQDLTLDHVVITPVAMIAYVGEQGEADTSEGAENFHGLAIAMNDVTDGETSVFSWALQDEETYEICEGVYSQSTSIEFYSSENMKGIYSTDILANHCGDQNHIHPAAEAAKNYSVDGFDPSAIGCSGWFLPTCGQRKKFFEACGVYFKYAYMASGKGVYQTVRSVTNKASVIFDEGVWWTSTQKGKDGSQFVSLSYDVPSQTGAVLFWGAVKKLPYAVRPFLAF
jgi:hypothetical protein